MKNMSILLTEHRFNHLQDCCLPLMYHLDDMADYPSETSNIINGITIIDNNFIEMKPINDTTELLGLHIPRPFHALVIDPSTMYSILIASFK